MIAMLLQQPQAAKALLEQWVRLYGIPDKQAFLGSDTLGAVIQQMQMPPMGGMPGMPGLPPGIDPTGGANNPASGLVNPAAQLPQERVGVQ